MATKSRAAPAAKTKPAPATKRVAKKAAKRPARAATPRAGAANPLGATNPFAGFDPGAMPGAADMAKMAKLMTPAQAIELYKVNSKLALDVINAALENTAKLRRHQFEGEEAARAMGRKAATRAAEAGSPEAFMAAGQSVSQEAMESAMRYWGQMFEMIVDMQKHLFTMMEGQMAGVPGVKEAKAAMAMMPDLRQAQNVINAMQGVV
ncbi:MAG: phasin family protein, partial [Casimicrobiaceae bacterium]